MILAALALTLAASTQTSASTPRPLPPPDYEPPDFGESRYAAHLAAQSAQRRLDAIYREALAAAKQGDQALSPEERSRSSAQSALADAQRGWLLYRAAQCALESYWARGGSMAGLLREQCIARMTGERIAQLRQPNPVTE